MKTIAAARRRIRCRLAPSELRIGKRPTVIEKGSNFSGSATVHRRERQHLKTVGGDGHGVLPLRGEFFIAGNHRPAIFLVLIRLSPWLTIGSMVNTMPSCSTAPSRAAVMQHLRFLMHFLTDAVTAIFSDHAIAMFLHPALNSVANIAQRRARLHPPMPFHIAS